MDSDNPKNSSFGFGKSLWSKQISIPKLVEKGELKKCYFLSNPHSTYLSKVFFWITHLLTRQLSALSKREGYYPKTQLWAPKSITSRNGTQSFGDTTIQLCKWPFRRCLSSMLHAPKGRGSVPLISTYFSIILGLPFWVGLILGN